MTVIHYFLFSVLLVTLIGVAVAKPLAGGSNQEAPQPNLANSKLTHRFFPGMVFLYKLSQGIGERTKAQRKNPHQMLVVEKLLLFLLLTKLLTLTF